MQIINTRINLQKVLYYVIHKFDIEMFSIDASKNIGTAYFKIKNDPKDCFIRIEMENSKVRFAISEHLCLDLSFLSFQKCNNLTQTLLNCIRVFVGRL